MNQIVKLIRPTFFSILLFVTLFPLNAQGQTLLYQFHNVNGDIESPAINYAHLPGEIFNINGSPNIFEFDGVLGRVFTEPGNGLIPIYRLLGTPRVLYNAEMPGTEENPEDWEIRYYAFKEPVSYLTSPVYRYRANDKWDFLSTNPNINMIGYEKSILFHIYDSVPSSNGKILNISNISQQTSLWCWAAIGEMTMAYYNTFVDQCEEAEKLIATASNCCPAANTPPSCIKGGNGITNLDNYNFSCDNEAPRSFEELKAEIDAHRPVTFRYEYSNSSGHYMLAYGYLENGNTQLVYVNDPWPVNKGATRIVTYEEWRNPEGQTHTNDFINITDRE